MLPTQFRFDLRQSPEFFKTAQKVWSKHFTLYFSDEKADSPLAAVIVPARKITTAVKRNATKRKVRSILTPIFSNQKLSGQFVVYVNRPLQAKTNQLQTELTQLFAKTNHG